MNKFLFLLIIYSINTLGQNRLVKDIDGDKLNDSIYVDNEMIYHKLSTKKYKPISINLINTNGGSLYVTKTKNGFQYVINLRRAGMRVKFKYNSKSEKIDLIEMSWYEYGNVSNDRSGESKVDILTNNYIGNWKYFDLNEESLLALPTIKAKMVLPKIDVTKFNEEYINNYRRQCSGFYDEHKNKYVNVEIPKEDKEVPKQVSKQDLQKVGEDVAFKNVALKNIPKFVKYDGKVKKIITWLDNQGTHYVLTSETGIYTNDLLEGYKDSNAELFAYHYIKKDTIEEKIWRVYDYVKECAEDIEAEFIKNTLHITDLDNDGIKEIWIMYRKVCHGDISPLEMKIIMYEGVDKYGMRGHNKIVISENNYYGGDYKFDESFKNGPSSFREFSKKMWNENVLYKWSE